MTNKVAKYLFDIEQAAERILAFVGDSDEAAYRQNLMMQSAVERQFGILGEALKKANDLDPTLPISHKREIIHYRNFILHAYDLVAPERVWDIIQADLPTLLEEVKFELKKM